MQGPTLTIAGRTLVFGTDLNVYETEKNIGSWTSESTHKDNKIRYYADGIDQKPLNAVYSFNDSNQLMMTLTTGDGSVSSDQFTFIGGIEIDQHHMLNFVLYDKQSRTKTVFHLTVYGELSFPADTTNLAILLPGGNTILVKAKDDVPKPLEAQKNQVASLKGDDLLTFHAETDNDVGEANLLTVPAKIDFVGKWDLRPDGLFFLSNIKSDQAGNHVAIALAGKLKAVSYGFIYSDDTGSCELNIAGKHTFQSGTLTWQSSIGYSDTKFTARVAIDGKRFLQNGKTLTLGGTMTLGPDMSIDIEVTATYAFDEHNVLRFKACMPDTHKELYDLQLTGEFQYANNQVTFNLDFKDDSGKKDLKLSLFSQGTQDQLISYLALILDISDQAARLELNAHFTARLNFRDGKKVVEKKPMSVTAPASAVSSAAH